MSTQTTTTQAASGAEGFVLVPKQATKAMLDAAYAAHDAYEAAETGGWGGLGSVYEAMIAAAPTPAPQPAGAERVDLVSYLERQWAWSKETFGPALRTKGIVQHITKELREIEAEPHDLAEWVDVIILAMDGFWRHGGKPEDLLPAMQAKQDRNFARTWPDWRTMGEDQAIEHDRTEEKRLAALVAAKAAEPVFQELAARLDAGINWPRYLPVIKEGPTGVSAWQVILPGGRLINLSDEEWQAAVDLGGPPRPAPCDGSGAAGETEGLDPQGDSAVPEGQAPTPDPVGEAKALLEGLPKDRTPEQHIAYRRWQASEPKFKQVAELCLHRAERIEAALATIRSSQAGEVRE